MSSAPDPERELDRLYGLPLAEFVPARDELAKQARSDGERELADRVTALRKPTVSAYVVNRLARERELDVQRLLKAGEGLADAQQEVAAGTSGDGFAEARREEQRALERLREAAQQIADREGLGAGVVERVTQSLRAASVTDEGRELLKRGRLTEDLQPPGFEALLSMPAVSARSAPRTKARPKRPSKSAEQAERRRELAEGRQRVRALQAEERRLAKRAAAAEREAERAERDAAALREDADRARSDAQQAAERRAEAEGELEPRRS
jgi:hypothetical protein